MRDRPPPGRRDLPARRRPSGQPPGQPAATLPGDYLRGGYLDSGGHLRPELVGTVAEEVAKTLRRDRLGLTSQPMAYGQLRRFWNLTLAIRNRFASEGSFAAVKADIQGLSAKAAYAVSRGRAPQVFKDFIDRNVVLALHSPDAFRKGFVRHFEAVIAFFSYSESRQRAAQMGGRR